MTKPTQGPLTSVRIVEFAGIGPAPFCASLLGDMGADVIRIDRAEAAGTAPGLLMRGRRSITLDLKDPAAVEVALCLIEKADGLIEGFRPGVMERLGLGPEVALARNPKLAYGRMTGWGQTGPLAKVAGHDINYIALSGALAAIGTPERPVAPLNLVGDFGGGSLYLAMGLLAAITHARAGGPGQVIDCAMVEGAASLMGLYYEFLHTEGWGARGSNLLDGAAPFYTSYACKDGKWLAVGSIEPQFYALLLDKLGLGDSVERSRQNERADWPDLQQRLTTLFRERTRDEWCALLEPTDACVAPILDMSEAPRHPHNQARGSFIERDGRVEPNVAPRFSATPAVAGDRPGHIGIDTAAVLDDWRIPGDKVAALRRR